MSKTAKGPRARNSTNVRALTLRLLGPLSRVAPRFASRLAIRGFFTTPRTLPSERTRAFLATGERAVLDFEGPAPVPGAEALPAGTDRVVAWRWGRGPTVLLVHGWGGVGGQLSAFVEPLVVAGYSVVTFDAPGHGESGGAISSLLHFSQAARAVGRRFGPFEAVVAHSLGGAAVAHALRHGLQASHLVFIGVPADIRRYPEGFLKAAGFSGELREQVMREVEQRLGFRWDELSIPHAARFLSLPLLIVHDFADSEVPFADGTAIASAWKGSTLHPTTGFGHRKVLREESVVRRAVDFIAGGLSNRAVSAR